ncbi:hypothetical protein, partial [Acidiphilium rubrum]|uniref:hypothetical protein n=1 Tax=Acidiphilium rubrum TaxID=526 RepID=UPI001C3785E4
ARKITAKRSDGSAGMKGAFEIMPLDKPRGVGGGKALVWMTMGFLCDAFVLPYDDERGIG